MGAWWQFQFWWQLSVAYMLHGLVAKCQAHKPTKYVKTEPSLKGRNLPYFPGPCVQLTAKQVGWDCCLFSFLTGKEKGKTAFRIKQNLSPLKLNVCILKIQIICILLHASLLLQYFIQPAGMADWRVAGEHINMKASNYLNMLKPNATNKQDFQTHFHFL